MSKRARTEEIPISEMPEYLAFFSGWVSDEESGLKNRNYWLSLFPGMKLVLAKMYPTAAGGFRLHVLAIVPAKTYSPTAIKGALPSKVTCVCRLGLCDEYMFTGRPKGTKETIPEAIPDPEAVSVSNGFF